MYVSICMYECSVVICMYIYVCMYGCECMYVCMGGCVWCREYSGAVEVAAGRTSLRGTRGRDLTATATETHRHCTLHCTALYYTIHNYTILYYTIHHTIHNYTVLDYTIHYATSHHTALHLHHKHTAVLLTHVRDRPINLMCVFMFMLYVYVCTRIYVCSH